MQIAKDFMNFVGYPIKRTQLHLTRELFLAVYTEGAREWGALIKRYDEFDSAGDSSIESTQLPRADDDLAAWLGDMDIHGSDSEEPCHTHGGGRRGPSGRSEKKGYELYRCSWCGNPSAVLRRCGGCGKTRCAPLS